MSKKFSKKIFYKLLFAFKFANFGDIVLVPGLKKDIP